MSASNTAVSDRLRELGIELPAVAAPVAAYVPAVRVGDLVYTSGQLPFVDGELLAAGKVREISAAGQSDSQGSVSPEQAKDAARIAALNALAAVDDLVGIDAVERIIKVTGFVASAPGFNGQPGVINGASELFGEIFGDAGQHARSAVGVNELPLNTPVEVEIIVQVRS
ncbi:MAG TPA: RidA family protein [Corynebacterium sp.]|uniref:RidA family protein n=1 Tax=Corynebacterium sp. TaxID=1720 RepID=UPI00180997C6|nr:RidA family protein [Corynebacterium sp.]MDY0113262.1 RidA family protein [Corynebacterium sp.]HHT33087.1 RidA family protein [Corynebacterium sp.]